MKSSLYRLMLLLLGVVLLLAQGCKKEAEIPDPFTNNVPKATAVNKFIWEGMHDYYLWVAKVPNLSATKYANPDTLNRFLNRYSDGEKLFDALLYQPEVVDKWSFIVSDYSEIDNWVAGISKSMGYDFMLSYIGQTNNLFGFVRYVLKDSPADKAGIKRGDLFLKVNGTQLTVSNYNSLLFGSDSYSLTFATISNNTISETSRVVNLQAVQLQENPVYLSKVMDINGQKTGYLMYNSFISEFDIQLNDVFKSFKDQGISNLIVDLRYNGGGSVQSAIYMGSMIYSTDKSKIFAKSVYNDPLQEYLVSQYGNTALNDYFTDNIEAVKDNTGNLIFPETAIASLGLERVYFLVSDNTASASELLINGLRPYMNVRVIGINTYGKYVGSITLKDYDEKGNLNTTHKYAMQPIVVKLANSKNFTDYVNGLTPDIVAEEDIANLLPLGDVTETLLQVAINDIKGVAPKQAAIRSELSSSKRVAVKKSRFSNEMFIDLPVK